MNHTETDLGSAVLMFNWIEYSVFSAMLILSLLIGVYFGWIKKQDTVAEYLLGGKKMGVFPVTMSLVASHISGITLLGVPSEVYAYGTQYGAIYITVVSVWAIINYLILPVFFHFQLNSAYEYLELRFSKGTRTLGSLIFAISLIIFIPVVIYVPALAFNQVTGVSVHIISLITSLICIFYTLFGGLKAVVWTDTLQGVFTLSSMIFILTLGYLKIGSVEKIWRINSEGHRLELFNLNPNPFERNTLWSVSVGSIFAWLSSIGVHPGAVQRFIAVATLKESKRVIAWGCVGFAIVQTLTIPMGLLLYAYYHGCDPVATKMIRKTSQILPYYVMDVARDFPGITGLFISGVLSAALSLTYGCITKETEQSSNFLLSFVVDMIDLQNLVDKCSSTMSAGLNTVAGTLYEDFVQFVLKGEKLSETSQNFTLKMIVLVLGLICVALVFIVERLGALFQMAISLQGISTGALLGLFSLGLFFPRANAKGAIAGALTSLVGMFVIIVGAQWFIMEKQLRFPGKVTSVAECPPDLTASLGFNATAYVQTWTGVGSPVVADESVPLIFRVSYMYYCLIGTVIVLLVGLPVSYLTGPQDLQTLDPHLLSPPIRRFLPQRRTSAKPAKEEYTLVTTDPASQDEKLLKDTQTKGT